MHLLMLPHGTCQPLLMQVNLERLDAIKTGAPGQRSFPSRPGRRSPYTTYTRSWPMPSPAAERLARPQVNLWGLDAIKTKGESVAIVLRLVGAAPVREGTGRIARFALRPLAELGRPRVDVLCNMSGIFRGARRAASRGRSIRPSICLACVVCLRAVGLHGRAG
jgi:hypothetical protein